MKEKIKLVIVFILGIMISVVISVYAATVIGAGEVSYTPGKVSASNVQDAIDGVYTSSNTLASNVTSLGNRVTTLEGTIKWTNSSPTSAFAAQTVNLGSDWKTSRTYFEVIYVYTIGYPYYRNTGKIPIGTKGCVLDMVWNDAIQNFTSFRLVETTSTGLKFYDTIDSSHNTANNRLVPYRIIVY